MEKIKFDPLPHLSLREVLPVIFASGNIERLGESKLTQMKNSRDLILGEVVYISIYRIPDS